MKKQKNKHPQRTYHTACSLLLRLFELALQPREEATLLLLLLFLLFTRLGGLRLVLGLGLRLGLLGSLGLGGGLLTALQCGFGLLGLVDSDWSSLFVLRRGDGGVGSSDRVRVGGWGLASLSGALGLDGDLLLGLLSSLGGLLGGLLGSLNLLLFSLGGLDLLGLSLDGHGHGLRGSVRSSRGGTSTGQVFDGLLVLLGAGHELLLVGLGHLGRLQVLFVVEDRLLVRALGMRGIVLDVLGGDRLGGRDRLGCGDGFDRRNNRRNNRRSRFGCLGTLGQGNVSRGLLGGRLGNDRCSKVSSKISPD